MDPGTNVIGNRQSSICNRLPHPDRRLVRVPRHPVGVERLHPIEPRVGRDCLDQRRGVGADLSHAGKGRTLHFYSPLDVKAAFVGPTFSINLMYDQKETTVPNVLK